MVRPLAQSWLNSLCYWLDADGHGQNLPPRLLCLQPVRGGAGGDRVPPDWRGGEDRDVPRLLCEVRDERREEPAELYFSISRHVAAWCSRCQEPIVSSRGGRTTLITCEGRKYHYNCYTCKVRHSQAPGCLCFYQLFFLELRRQSQWEAGLPGAGGNHLQRVQTVPPDVVTVTT